MSLPNTFTGSGDLTLLFKFASAHLVQNTIKSDFPLLFLQFLLDKNSDSDFGVLVVMMNWAVVSSSLDPHNFSSIAAPWGQIWFLIYIKSIQCRGYATLVRMSYKLTGLVTPTQLSGHASCHASFKNNFTAHAAYIRVRHTVYKPPASSWPI